MTEEMVLRFKEFCKDPQNVLDFSNLRYAFMPISGLSFALLYSAAKVWYGRTAVMVIIAYFSMLALICLVGQSVMVARISQALQLFCFTLTTGAMGEMILSLCLLYGSPNTIVPAWIFWGIFSVWPCLTISAGVIMYIKTLEGKFSWKVTGRVGGRAYQLATNISAFIGSLIIIAPPFIRMITDSYSMIGKSIMLTIGWICGTVIIGASGMLSPIIIAKAKFPSFNAQIPTTREIHMQRRKKKIADKTSDSTVKNNVYFQVNDINVDKGISAFKNVQQSVGKWLKSKK
ncbi:hypothetical protein [Schleiferilactobacillus perolens]|uniref:hypothetical protein n=1 Tax=Schleiferilactobacillus perolens TaxID=100468 RepID=UPI0039E840C7